jgi:hypothetical protein
MRFDLKVKQQNEVINILLQIKFRGDDMVKVVRQAKTSIDNNISHEAIALSFVDKIPVLDVAPKQTITIKYNAEGKPTPATINAGNLGDHRAT